MNKNLILTPFPDTTVAISGTTTSASSVLTTKSNFVQVVNSGTTVAFVRFGVGSATALTTDYPILGGQSVILAKAETETYIGAIMASGTATIYVTAIDYVK